MASEANPKPAGSLAQAWVLVAGAMLGGLTLLFFMTLVVLGIFGKEVPCGSTYLVNVTLSLGAALSAAFLGGNASAKGALPLPFLQGKPLAVSFSGGIAVLAAMLVLTTNLFGRTACQPSVAVSCPIGFQPYAVDLLRFGFCYPREGWELDSSPIQVRAADIYLRQSENRDVGVHFHVALIPAAWSGRPDAYSEQVANTWKQLDSQLQVSKAFIGGREAHLFRLTVKDRLGRSRPTEITHIYLDAERLLEIIVTWFQDSRPTVLDQMQRVLSTLTFARV